MKLSGRRIQAKMKSRTIQYLTCGAKTATFLLVATFYMIVMKLTVFKDTHTSSVRDRWALPPDNYSKWMAPANAIDYDFQTNVNSFTDWIEPDNATIKELEDRSIRVDKVCRLRSVPRNKINSKEFFIDHAHNIVWCNIFKAASSFWLHKFNILGGYDLMMLAHTNLTPLTLARNKFHRPKEDEVREAVTSPGVVSLLIVREPFVRLLSAFRDKLETKPCRLYYRNLTRTIISEFREQAVKVLGKVTGSQPTFYEFVAYLIDRHKKNGSHAFDEHWAPYYQFCTPCAVNFTVIAKVETLNRDSAHVIQQLGLWPVLGNKSIHPKNRRHKVIMNRSQDGRNTTSLLKKYFNQLDQKMLKDLLAIYGLDFDMFGYDPNIYYEYVRK